MKAFLRGIGLAAIICFSAHGASGVVPYAIAAANQTMPMSGNGSTSFSVTGIPMTGTLSVVCAYSGPATSAKVPNCNSGPLRAYQVTAGETITGSITFFPYGVVVPLAEHASGNLALALMALPVAFLIGVRGKNGRRLSIIVLGIAAVASVSACGGASGSRMTPGNYQYTITANNESNPNTPLGQGVSTTIIVTVP